MKYNESVWESYWESYTQYKEPSFLYSEIYNLYYLLIIYTRDEIRKNNRSRHIFKCFKGVLEELVQ
jgi:prolipoprotein diacylglyceryltransferase